MNAQKILIVDDQKTVYEKLCNTHSPSRVEFEYCYSYASANAFLKRRGGNVDLVLLDIEMPETNGIEAARLLKADYPELLVIMLTLHDSPESLFNAIKAGADGYWFKDELDCEVDMLFDRRYTFSPQIAQKVLSLFREYTPTIHAPKKFEGLTKREQDIVTLLGQGKTLVKSAEELGIAHETARKHLKNVFKKLQINSQIELMELINKSKH